MFSYLFFPLFGNGHLIRRSLSDAYVPYDQRAEPGQLLDAVDDVAQFSFDADREHVLVESVLLRLLSGAPA